MRILFITVGDPRRLTGGYLYHREVFARLRAGGVVVDELVACGASLAEQLAAAPALGARLDPLAYDAIVVDALARAVAAPWLDAWRARRPLVALVHELPSVAERQYKIQNTKCKMPGSLPHPPPAGMEYQLPSPPDADELAWEAPLLRADRLITVSADGAAILRARGVPAERIVVAPGGFDRLLHPPRRSVASPLRRSIAPPLNRSAAQSPRRSVAPPLTALAVAQWIPRKGLVELVRAWGQVVRPGWALALVGEDDADPAYAGLVRAAIAAAPAGSVVARGKLSDAELRDAYAAAACFALPSRYEGYGIAFAEALAHGLPVVACATGPVPDLVGPAAGLLVPVGDEPALAAALARLMDDAALRATMARAALARAAALPTWDDTAQALRTLLQELCSRPAAPPA